LNAADGRIFDLEPVLRRSIRIVRLHEVAGKFSSLHAAVPVIDLASATVDGRSGTLALQSVS
jgi:hypothetical protein